MHIDQDEEVLKARGCKQAGGLQMANRTHQVCDKLQNFNFRIHI